MDEVFVKDKKELWNWLRDNHESKNSVWLVYYKPSTNKSDITVNDIVDYCLCFGWVDSLVNKLDDQRTKIRISPRNPKSSWSQVNKDKVKELVRLGLMQESGLRMIDTAKKNGAWSRLDEVEKLIIPDDLKKELVKRGMLDKWDKKSRSFKRGLLEMLLNSKRPETRMKTILKIIEKI